MQHTSATPSPSEIPDSLATVQVTEATFEDFLDTFVESQADGLELEPIGSGPWKLPPSRRTTNRGA